MSRQMLLFLFLFVVFNGRTQQISRINFDEIKKVVADSSSEFFYPNLVRRTLEFDSTLSREAFMYLYYGNVFQRYYHPYGATNQHKSFREAFERYAPFEEIESLGMAVLNENPVNLEVILKMIFLYNREKREEKATDFARLYVSFLETIYASGTGKDCENSFVVISVDDEYRIAGDLGLKVVKQALIGVCDRLHFSKKGQKRKNRIKELYFNVRMPLTYLSKSYDQSDLPEAEVDPDEEE